MMARLATATLYVADQEAAVMFYEQKLGFTLRRRHALGEGAWWFELTPPGAATAVVLYPRALMTDWASRKPSLIFDCDDLEETCRELAERGVAFSRPLQSMPWGKFASILDPDGNELGLRQGDAA